MSTGWVEAGAKRCGAGSPRLAPLWSFCGVFFRIDLGIALVGDFLGGSVPGAGGPIGLFVAEAYELAGSVNFDGSGLSAGVSGPTIFCWVFLGTDFFDPFLFAISVLSRGFLAEILKNVNMQL